MPGGHEALLPQVHPRRLGRRQPRGGRRVPRRGLRAPRLPTRPPLGRAEQIDLLKGFRAAFPDISIEVQDVFASDDRVAFRSVMRGTHRGAFLGIEPTGQRVDVNLLDIWRISHGKVVERWGGPDTYDLTRQLQAH